MAGAYDAMTQVKQKVENLPNEQRKCRHQKYANSKRTCHEQLEHGERRHERKSANSMNFASDHR
jgi:hypothetical protein